MKVIDEACLDKYRGPGVCDFCRKQVRNREPHHLQCRGMGSGSRLDIDENIASLCATFAGGDNCHHRAHWGLIPREELFKVVAKREGKTVRAIKTKIARLLRTPKK